MKSNFQKQNCISEKSMDKPVSRKANDIRQSGKGEGAEGYSHPVSMRKGCFHILTGFG